MTEQELMLTNLLNCRRVDLYVDPRPLSSGEEKLLRQMHRRRARGEPLQYILGSCEFMGLEFSVDPRVLVPRPETELLVEEAVRITEDLFAFRPCRILDIGTGSGNIAVSLARAAQHALVTAVDVCEAALAAARRNAQQHNVSHRVRFFQSDIFSALEDEKFNMIVTNPPYIPSDEIKVLSREVRREPQLALDGGKDGLDFYRRIFEGAPKFLGPGGVVLAEIGDGQRTALEVIMSRNGFRVKDCLRDYRNIERILIGEYKANG
jgi:release factor glutamine methyltransferase